MAILGPVCRSWYTIGMTAGLTAILCLPCPGMAESPVQDGRRMDIYVTVDWEGANLAEDNLDAMRQFRRKFPQIAMVQLLNPAYFVQPAADPQQVARTIRTTLLPEDTLGLHLHGWQSLVNYCGLAYQSGPSISGQTDVCVPETCGYTVSLEYAYSEKELTQLVACSSQLLVDNGFARPRHFRAGGWQFGPKLQAAIQANGFVWDSSRIDAQLLIPRWPANSPLVTLLQKLHPDSTPLDQPYALSAQLMEFPNNAALADYTSTRQILQLFEQLLSHHKPVMVLGFHQETAADYLIHLEQAIPHMQHIASQHRVTLRWQH